MPFVQMASSETIDVDIKGSALAKKDKVKTADELAEVHRKCLKYFEERFQKKNGKVGKKTKCSFVFIVGAVHGEIK